MSKIDRNWRGIEQVNIAVVEKWLIEQGWTQIPALSALPDHIWYLDDFGITLPTDTSVPMYYAKLYKAIDGIALTLDEPTYPLLQKFIEMSNTGKGQ